MTEHRPYGACDGVPMLPDEPCLFTVPVARALLDLAREHHVLAVQGAIAAGVPLDELAHNADASDRTIRHLIALAGGDA